jgi:hypothetical protein
MLNEPRERLAIELSGLDGGLSLMPSHRLTPKAHRFQGGLNFSRAIELAGRIATPHGLAGRPIRLWLSQLGRWNFGRHERPHIGDLYDRTGELPGGGLEATLYIPKDAWLSSMQCLGTVWRRLELTAVDGDGRRMTIVDCSFSSATALLR